MPDHGHTVGHGTFCWEQQNGKTTPDPAPQTPWQSCWSQEGVVVCAGLCLHLPHQPQRNQLPITSFWPLIDHSCSLWHHEASEGDLWPPPHIPCLSSSTAGSRAELRAPQPVAPQAWLSRAGPLCSKSPKRKHLETHPLLTWCLCLSGWQNYLLGFHFHRQEVPVKGSGSCPWHPSLAWGCAQGTPKQPLGWDCPGGDGWA